MPGTSDGTATYTDYGRSASLYDAYTPRVDYALGARRLVAMIREENPAARTLLDVGCGSGRYLEQLQHEFECEGIDLALDFVDISRRRCPAVPIHQGNMIDFDLGRTFDVVTCLFVAIAYTRTVEAMEQAVANMARHLAPGGLLFFEPWVYPENFWDDRFTSEYVDEADRKIARMFIARREGPLSVYDIHYLVGSADGIEHFVEREELGLFTHEQYMGAIEKAGLQPHYERDGGLFEAHNIGMYRGVKR